MDMISVFTADCAAGEYYDNNVKVCLKCDFGTYQDQLYQTECEVCPSGTTTEVQGSTQDSDCIGRNSISYSASSFHLMGYTSWSKI